MIPLFALTGRVWFSFRVVGAIGMINLSGLGIAGSASSQQDCSKKYRTPDPSAPVSSRPVMRMDCVIRRSESGRRVEALRTVEEGCGGRCGGILRVARQASGCGYSKKRFPVRLRVS